MHRVDLRRPFAKPVRLSLGRATGECLALHGAVLFCLTRASTVVCFGAKTGKRLKRQQALPLRPGGKLVVSRGVPEHDGR